MQTLWQKQSELATAKWFWHFSTSTDRSFDQQLIPYEILSNLAHTQILRFNELITDEEHKQLRTELLRLWNKRDELSISENDEDVHSFLEKHLTGTLGELGKRIHTMRSRNDLILADTRLWGKENLIVIAEKIEELVKVLIKKAKSQKVWFPGLTHTQIAMPQCSDTFFIGFAELLIRVASGLEWAWRRLDVLPMGSAAGYGAPYFDVQTQIYGQLLGFGTVYSSVSYNQLSRGLEEQASIAVIDEILQVVNRLAADLIFMASDINGWVRMDDDQVSGSSIMPQKRNPDAWELIRSESHRLTGALMELKTLTSNLSSGYHRDLQRVKHIFMSALGSADYLLEVAILAIQGVHFDEENCKKAMKPEVFATHIANKLTKDGVPFRDAYRQASEMYKDASLTNEELSESYTYKGTPGNAAFTQLEKIVTVYSEDVARRKSFYLGALRKLTTPN